MQPTQCLTGATFVCSGPMSGGCTIPSASCLPVTIRKFPLFSFSCPAYVKWDQIQFSFGPQEF